MDWRDVFAEPAIIPHLAEQLLGPRGLGLATLVALLHTCWTIYGARWDYYALVKEIPDVRGVAAAAYEDLARREAKYVVRLYPTCLRVVGNTSAEGACCFVKQISDCFPPEHGKCVTVQGVQQLHVHHLRDVFVVIVRRFGANPENASVVRDLFEYCILLLKRKLPGHINYDPEGDGTLSCDALLQSALEEINKRGSVELIRATRAVLDAEPDRARYFATPDIMLLEVLENPNPEAIAWYVGENEAFLRAELENLLEQGEMFPDGVLKLVEICQARGWGDEEKLKAVRRDVISARQESPLIYFDPSMALVYAAIDSSEDKLRGVGGVERNMTPKERELRDALGMWGLSATCACDGCPRAAAGWHVDVANYTDPTPDRRPIAMSIPLCSRHLCDNLEEALYVLP